MEWSERIGRRIKLRDIHILLTVVQCGNMTKAAKQLAVSKPVVSKVIADLESVVGVRLLDRDRNGTEPTIYGAALLRHGAVAFDELKQGVQEIEFLTDPTVGELRVGATAPMIAGILPMIVDRLRRRHPRLVFDVVEGTGGPALHRELRERNVDLILSRMTTPITDDDLHAEILFDDPQFVVSGPRNRWARRRRIGLADLIHEPWMMPRPNTEARAVIAANFAASGLELPRADVLCHSFTAQSVLLASGNLLAIWPASVLRFGSRNFSVKVLPVKLPAMRRPVGITTLKSRTISPVARLFIDCAGEIAKLPDAQGQRLRTR